MSRRRSVAFIPVAVGALLGGLGVFSVSAAPPAGTDASEVSHWNQVAATHAHRVPGAERRCAACIPDQHGHGAGRRLRRGQRDRPEDSIGHICSRSVRVRRRRSTPPSQRRRTTCSRISSRRHPSSAPFPGRAGLLATLVHASAPHRSMRSTMAPSRSRASQIGHAAAKAMLDARVGDGRFGPSQWVPERRRRTLAAAPQSDDGAPILDPTPWVGGVKPFLIQSSSQFRSVPPPELDSAAVGGRVQRGQEPRPSHRLDPETARRRRTSPGGGRAHPV